MSTSDPDLRVPYGYEVVHRLGSGQTSHVHLARHARYGKVALKLPRPELEERPVLRRMFENEVMITLRLQHVRVVRGLDGHPTGTGAYLALEMCPGGTLDQHLLERGRLPLPEAIRLVTEVAEGLAYTHGRKVLHRDVKPANVFLDGDGHAKLGDFGTGVFFASDDASERVGTAFYMAPEIFEGAASDVRSDVYALGVLAYEVLTGQRPFRGDTFDALMHAHMGGLLQDPMSVRADLPKDLARTIRTALARRPDRRHADVDAFLEAWHGAGAPETTDGSATSERRSASPSADAGSSGDADADRPSSGRGGRAGRARHAAATEGGDVGAAGGEQGKVRSEGAAESEAESATAPWWRRLLGGRRGD